MAQSAAAEDREPLQEGLPQRMGIDIAVVAWHGPLCHALRRVLAHAPAEAHLFRNTLAHAAEHGGAIARDARDQPVGRELKPDQFPLASFLLVLAPRLEPIERTLSWLVLEAHLSRGHHDLVVALAQVIRGLSRGGSSKLGHTVLECDGPSQLLAKMHRLGGEHPEIGRTGHRNFDALWRDSLHAFCAALVSQAPDGLHDDAELGGGLDQPSVLTEDPLDGAGEDPDEGIHQPSLSVEPGKEIRNKPMRHALDWSVHMSRRSSPDLLRPVENVLPPEIREHRRRRAVRDAELALAKDDVLEAQYAILAILSLETGLSAKEALQTAFGTNVVSKSPVIDLDAHALRRPELLPPNSFLPKEGDDRWIPTGGDAIFPLSSGCVDLIRRLRAARSRRSPILSSSLLLSNDPRPDGMPVPIDGGKMRAAIKAEHRLVLAIAIADAMGLDAAQRAFGDTFGLSAAPVFYGTYPALDLAQVLVHANSFVGHEAQGAPWAPVASHMLGSRARPRDPPYARVWEKLQGRPGRRKGRPSERQLVEQWRLWRDRLLIHFLLATGHRPDNSIGDMILHDFIPRHALAVVGDKQADPLHETRLVCTGWRFVGELDGFVAELTRISRNSSNTEARKLASSILAGTAPIFAIPADEGHSLPRVRTLLAGLDPLWGDRPNVHRHGLCQYLQQRRVDPEYRYFQMGWLCHDHHATSDTAPYVPASLGEQLSGVVDEWLDHCGWLGGRQPKHPTNLVPPVPLTDWAPKLEAHVKSSQVALLALKAQLRESARSLEADVWERISSETPKVLSHFEPSPSGQKPAFRRVAALGDGHAAMINHVQVEALLAPFAKASCSPAERYVAAKVLHKALLATAKTTGVQIYLPSVPVLSRSRVSSPFPRALGLAVAQMDYLQAKLIAHVTGLENPLDKRSTTELAAIAASSILLHTACSSVESALVILKAVKNACHAHVEPWQLRIPFGSGHVVLRGDPAILATQLLQQPGWEEALQRLSRNEGSSVGAFLAKVAPALNPEACPAADFVRLLAGTANVAKLIRLNGSERLVQGGTAVPALVSALRAASVADGVTVGTNLAPEGQVEAPAHEPPPAGENPRHRPMRNIRHVMRAFDPDFEGKILGERAEPAARRRPQLKRLLEDALSTIGAAPTASRNLLEYAWHLLTEGGPRSSGGQAISTISKTYRRLEPLLRGVHQDDNLETLRPDEMTALCRLSCEASRRKSSKEVLDELKRFLAYTRLRYHVPEPDWAVLYREYGQPVQGGDPALVADAEAALVMHRLHDNVMSLSGTDSDPAERRFREVCLAAALIAEAGGIRPGSTYGLTLADALLGPETDYVHLRSSGRFASIKTSTSAGYIPLEGELWKRYRPWFADWLSRICVTIPPEEHDTVPLFQIPGEAIGVRYEMAKVFSVIGEHVRWATAQAKGRSYWFRKRRARARHVRVIANPGSKARDMAKVMRSTGHALMMTPLVSYLSEPGAFVSGDLMAHAVASSPGAAVMSGLAGRTSPRAPRGHTPGSPAHVASLLGLGAPVHPVTPISQAPLVSRYQGDLAWSSVERILRDMVGGKDPEWLAARHGIEAGQVSSIAAARRALAARMKIEFGMAASELAPPRRIAAMQGWYEKLDATDMRLRLVALEWVDVASSRLIHLGCELNDERAIDALKEIGTELGISCLETKGEHGTILVRFQEGTGEPEGRAAYGVWPTIRWLLAMIWMSEYRLAHRAGCPPSG